MKKIHMIAALLAMLLPTMSVWAGSFNYTAKVNTWKAGTGDGTVYVGNAAVSQGASKTTDEPGSVAGSSDNKGNNVTCTFTIKATPGPNSIFSGWKCTGNGTIQNTSSSETTVALVATSSAKDPSAEVVATFISTLPIDVQCVQPHNGSYSFNGTSISGTDKTVTVAYPYSVTVSATASTNFKHSGWWTEDADGNVTKFPASATSLELPGSTKKFGADFAPDGVAIYAFRSGTIYTADKLADALSEAQEGESIVVYENVTVNENAVLSPGVSLTISEGVTVTVAAGSCLTLAGNLENNGTIAGSGSIALNYKTITQESTINVPFPYGTDGVETGTGLDKTDGTGDGTAGKYVKTRVSNGISSINNCTVQNKQWFVTIVNGEGESFITATSAAKPIAVLCKVNRNWVAD